MSDFAIKFFIAFPCSAADAARFFAVRCYLIAEQNGDAALLEPSAAALLQDERSDPPETYLAELLSTGEGLGVDCSYDSASQHLHIWSIDPTPDLHALSVVCSSGFTLSICRLALNGPTPAAVRAWMPTAAAIW
jgi:hypothetical protein